MASVADKVVSATGAVPIKVTLFADSRFFSAKLDRALASLQDTLVRLEETRGGENGKVYTLGELAFLLNEDSHDIVGLGASLDNALVAVDVVIVAVGINDVKSMALGAKVEFIVEAYLRNVALVIAALRRKGHRCPIMFVHPFQLGDRQRGWFQANKALGLIADEVGMMSDKFFERGVVFVRAPFDFPKGLAKDHLHLNDDSKMQALSALSEAAADIRGFLSGPQGVLRGVQLVTSASQVEAKVAKRPSDAAGETARIGGSARTGESARASPSGNKRQAVPPASGHVGGAATLARGAKMPDDKRSYQWRGQRQVGDGSEEFMGDSVSAKQELMDIWDYSSASGYAQGFSGFVSHPPTTVGGADVPVFLKQIAAGVNKIKIDGQ